MLVDVLFLNHFKTIPIAIKEDMTPKSAVSDHLPSTTELIELSDIKYIFRSYSKKLLRNLKISILTN